MRTIVNSIENACIHWLALCTDQVEVKTELTFGCTNMGSHKHAQPWCSCLQRHGFQLFLFLRFPFPRRLLRCKCGAFLRLLLRAFLLTLNVDKMFGLLFNLGFQRRRCNIERVSYFSIVSHVLCYLPVALLT